MKTETLFTHGIDAQGRRFTLAAVLEIKSEKEVKTSVGLAICSEKDNFNKKFGRIISEGRAKKGKVIDEFVITDDDNGFKAFKEKFFGLKEKVGTDVTKFCTEYKG